MVLEAIIDRVQSTHRPRKRSLVLANPYVPLFSAWFAYPYVSTFHRPIENKEKPTRPHMDPHVPKNKVYMLNNEIGRAVSSVHDCRRGARSEVGDGRGSHVCSPHWCFLRQIARQPASQPVSKPASHPASQPLSYCIKSCHIVLKTNNFLDSDFNLSLIHI